MYSVTPADGSTQETLASDVKPCLATLNLPSEFDVASSPNGPLKFSYLKNSVSIAVLPPLLSSKASISMPLEFLEPAPSQLSLLSERISNFPEGVALTSTSLPPESPYKNEL